MLKIFFNKNLFVIMGAVMFDFEFQFAVLPVGVTALPVVDGHQQSYSVLFDPSTDPGPTPKN